MPYTLSAMATRRVLNTVACQHRKFSLTTRNKSSLSIVSRRVAERIHKSKLGSKVKSEGTTTNKTEETSWPRSIQMLGYFIGFLSIPFSFGAAVVELPSFRRLVLGGDEDQLQASSDSLSIGQKMVGLVRDFWADDEYTPSEEALENKESGSSAQKSFDSEISYRLRREQNEVGALIRSPQKALISIYASSTEPSSVHERVLDGEIPLKYNDNKEILKHLELDDKSIDSLGVANETIAIDFLDDETENHQEGEVVGSYTQDLAKRSRDFCGVNQKSIWQEATDIISPPEETSVDMSHTLMSEKDYKKSKLEWKRSELKAQLDDPLCQRTIDDVQAELKEVERELRRLRFSFFN